MCVCVYYHTLMSNSVADGSQHDAHLYPREGWYTYTYYTFFIVGISGVFTTCFIGEPTATPLNGRHTAFYASGVLAGSKFLTTISTDSKSTVELDWWLNNPLSLTFIGLLGIAVTSPRLKC